MDQNLRNLERKYRSGDAEATEQYIKLLQRLAGFSDKPIIIWVSIYRVSDKSWPIVVALSKPQVVKITLKYLIDEIRDMTGMEDDHLADEENKPFYAQLQDLFDAGKYDECMLAWQQDWAGYDYLGPEVEMYCCELPSGE